MSVWIASILIIVVVLAAWPCIVIFAQCVIAALPNKRGAARSHSSRPKLGVLIPAHNEEEIIQRTLESILPQLTTGDRLLVVADNCCDGTARIAAEVGVEVLTRNESTRRGKGFALRAGLDRFRQDPPPVVVVIDADCTIGPGCLAALAECVAETSRPVQGCYLMTAPAGAGPLAAMSSLAVLVKNRVRPLAMARLGLPCLITGSGSAFPWQALEARSFAGDNIVEDMQLAVDLTLAGFAPSFCDRAVLSAPLPDRRSAFMSQRRRWEHGHLGTILTQGPRLLGHFLKTGRFAAAAMLVDLAVPPLSLLVLLLTGLLAVAFCAAIAGFSWLPAAITAGGLILLALSVGLAWWRFERGAIPFWLLLTAPIYVVAKVPIYARFLLGRQRVWERTIRPSEPGKDAALERGS